MDESKLLSNINLEYYTKKLKLPLHQIRFVSQLKTIKTPKIGNYIINLDRSETNGTHWSCFIIYPSKLVYYDSFGVINQIPPEVIQFGKRFNPSIKFVFNYDVIQDTNSIYCGWFVLYFIYFFNKNKKCQNKRLLLTAHNKKFDKTDLLQNDLILKILIKEIFSN